MTGVGDATAPFTTIHSSFVKAILLIDHGSKREPANEMLSCMANLLQQLAGTRAIVRFAHMELASPSIGDGFAQCVHDGATEVIAFPYMLSPGRHSTSDIPDMVALAAAAFPGVSYRVTGAFGVEAQLAEIILRRTGLAEDVVDDSARRCWNQGDNVGACGDACCMRRGNAETSRHATPG